MYKRISLLILITLSLTSAMAQRSLQVITATTATNAQNPGIDKSYYTNTNEPPRALEFKERTVTTSYFLSNINGYLNIPSAFTFVEAESSADNLGMQHRLLQQYHNGVPLEGLGYRVHEKNGFVTAANGKAVREIRLDTRETLTEEQALSLAKKYVQSKDTTRTRGKKLIVSKNFTYTSGSFHIAFQFDVDVSFLERWQISIDARTGEVVNKVSLVNSCLKETHPPLPYVKGVGLTSYYGRQAIRVEETGVGTQMEGQTDHGGVIGTFDFQHGTSRILSFPFSFNMPDFTSTDNTYTTVYAQPAASAQWAMEQAYEYYFTKHGRNSFDNNGSMIKSYVHVDVNFDNAFWNGRVLALGDGSNNNPLVELDVISHELTHGVTQYEAKLQYYNEPGALNESFSDIMAKSVEFSIFGDTATWQIARHFYAGGLRNMSNPNARAQPDTYFGNMWVSNGADYGGVHTNSGVQNFWFYLLCKGGSGVNDHQMSYSVNAIGMDAATKITYRNLTEYLSSASDFLDSRIGSLLATADLYGKNSVAYQQVANAWDAVGVIAQPIITSLVIYDITATTARIKGSIQPRSDTVNYHFEYGTTPALGNSSSIFTYADSISSILTGLQSTTKYFFRLIATNKSGSSYYNTSFTTPSSAPMVKIKHAVDFTETSATLYGSINPNSLFTSFFFAYGPTPALGLTTPSYALSDTTEFVDVSAAIIGLQRRQTYYYKLVATNSFASAETETVSFFTASRPVLNSFVPISAPVNTTITIVGQNFNTKPEKNAVRFGATRATILSCTATEIKVSVPSGASLGPITVIDLESGLSTESIGDFIPTFTGGFAKGGIQLRAGFADIDVYKTLVQDIDGDTRPDIIARTYDGFTIFQNVNDGGDITPDSFIPSSYAIDYADDYISLTDFDGNGLQDIVVKNQGNVRIYPNLSVPGYIFFGSPVDVPTGYLLSAVCYDVDQDGRIDIVGNQATGDNSLLKVFRNLNSKGFLNASDFKIQYTQTVPFRVYSLTARDFNNDGTFDLIFGIDAPDTVMLLKNNSRPGVWAFENVLITDPSILQGYRYIATDLNHDGSNDIISNSPYRINGSTVVLENSGASSNITLEKPFTLINQLVSPEIKAGDINGDGNVDLVVGTETAKFIFFENKTQTVGHLSPLSFKKFETYGTSTLDTATYLADAFITVNDLNGDGKPEVVTSYRYHFSPHDGYGLEIWQSAPNNCPDGSLVTVNVVGNGATFVLPPNTTPDQFEITYKTSFWNSAWTVLPPTTLSITVGYGVSVQVKVRAKCYMGLSDYFYLNFVTDCVDMNALYVGNVGATDVTLQTSNYNFYLSSYEIQYSVAGKNQWTTASQYGWQITGLTPGTSYDVRFRGRCSVLTDYKYLQFTTLCPTIISLSVDAIDYTYAHVAVTTSYYTRPLVEYSQDRVRWLPADQNNTLYPLVPGQQYYVRSKIACSNASSDYLYTLFTTNCPQVSTLTIGSITPFGARVIWTDNYGVGDYILTYGENGGKPTTTETNKTYFDLVGLTPGTPYTASVTPQCFGMKNIRATAFSTTCYAVSGLSLDGTTNTTADLSWNDNFSGGSYSIDYAIVNSNNWQTSRTGLTHITLSNLWPGYTYEARVHINCTSQKPPYLSIHFQTSLYDETVISPNPTDSKITINPAKDLIGSHFCITDNTGKILVDGTLVDYRIDLSEFSTGIYLLKIDGEKPVKIVKY